MAPREVHVARSHPAGIAARVRIVGAGLLLVSVALAAWATVRGDLGWAAAFTLGAFAALLLIGARPSVRGVEVAVTSIGVEWASFAGAEPIRRSWTWDDVVSAEVVDLLRGPPGGEHLDRTVVEVIFRDRQTVRVPLDWEGAAPVVASLLSRRFHPNG